MVKILAVMQKGLQCKVIRSDMTVTTYPWSGLPPDVKAFISNKATEKERTSDEYDVVYW